MKLTREIAVKIYNYIKQRRFKKVFGADTFLTSEFHLVCAPLALLSLKDRDGKVVTHPYTKRGEDTSISFSVESPVSIVGWAAPTFTITRQLLPEGLLRRLPNLQGINPLLRTYETLNTSSPSAKPPNRVSRGYNGYSRNA